VNPLRQIKLTIPDLAVGLQETMLVLRHGRKDEEEGAYGELRRELYRFMSRALSERELDFELEVQAGAMACTLQSKRFYHHEGYVYRVCYLTEDIPSIFKNGQAKTIDMAVTQIAAWAAGKAWATAPKGVRLLYHRISDDPTAENPIIESKQISFDLFDPTAIEEHISQRLKAIADHWDIADAELPACTDEERFALKTDPHSKCRASCRVRDFCQQYAAVRANGSSQLERAKATLAGI